MSKIIGKIRKLLAITKDASASEEEIKNALGHAKRLMDEYHISEGELGEESTWQFSDFRSFVGGQLYHWETALAGFVKQFTDCPMYLDNTKRIVIENGKAKTKNGQYVLGKSIVWYGPDVESSMACEIYNELRRLISAKAKKNWGSVFKGDGAVYAQGFINGLAQKVREAKEETRQAESTALTVCREALIQRKTDEGRQWLSRERGIELAQKTRKGGATGNPNAFAQGVRDGKSTNVDHTRAKKLA